MKQLLLLPALFLMCSLSTTSAQALRNVKTKALPLPTWQPPLHQSSIEKNAESPIGVPTTSKTKQVYYDLKRHKDAPEEAILLSEEDLVPSGLLRDYYHSSKPNFSKSFTENELVQNMLSEPSAYNVYVEIETQDGQSFQCTGALIDAKWVLISGNCLSSSEFAGEEGLIAKAVVYPAFDTRTNAPFGFAESIAIFTYIRWRFDRDFNHNIGYFALDRPIGATVKFWLGILDSNVSAPGQFFDFGLEQDNTYITETFTNESYPVADGFEAGRLYTRSGNFDEESIQEFLVYNDQESVFGQSGSALYRFDNGVPKISGILSHTRQGQSGYVRLDADKVADITESINDGYLIENPDPNGAPIIFVESRPFSPDLIPFPAPNVPVFTNTQQNQGEQLDTLYAGVTNYSKNAYDRNFTIEVFISKDDQYDILDEVIGSFEYDRRIEPDETLFFDLSNNVSLPEDLADGQYYIGIQIDAFETDRGNRFNNVPLQGDLRPISIGTGIDSENPCERAFKLNCGETYTLNNFDATDDYDNDDGLYNTCFPDGSITFRDYTGKDLLLSFDVIEASDVTIELTELGTFFDVAVFEDCSAGLTDNAIVSGCLGIANRGGRFEETLELTNLASGTYYIIVDADIARREGDFNIRVSCPIPTVDLCSEVDGALGCGDVYTGSTIGGESSFNGTDYEGFCLNDINPQFLPFDAPDQLLGLSVPEGETWSLVLESSNGEDLDMFLFEDSSCENGIFSTCFEKRITVDGREVFDNIPTGNYYVVVDGYLGHIVDDFTLAVFCETEGDFKPTICDLGGEFVSEDQVTLLELSLDATEDIPLSNIDLPLCVQERYINANLETTFFDTYVLYLSEEDAAEGFKLKFDPSLTAFVLSCEQNGQITTDCIAFSDALSGGTAGELNFVPSAAQEGIEFYYIVIAGQAGSFYDLDVQIGNREGPCRAVDSVIDSLGVSEFGNLFDQSNSFDLVVATDATNIYSCYVGDYTFEGSDIVYQLDIRETVNFDVVFDTDRFATLPGTEFGIFLYDYRCGSEGGCIRYDETKGDDRELNMNVEITPGFYYLVLDSDISGLANVSLDENDKKYYDLLAKNGQLNPYQINVSKTESLTKQEFVAPACGEEYDPSQLSEEELSRTSHEIRASRKFQNVQLGNYRLSSRDVFAYYYQDRDRLRLAAANTYDEEGFSIRLPGVEKLENLDEKCSFVNGDAVIIKIDDGHSTVYDVQAKFGTKLDGSKSDGNFLLGGEMILDSLELLEDGVNGFKLSSNSVNFTNARRNSAFFILTDDAWEIEGPPGVVFKTRVGRNNVEIEGGEGRSRINIELTDNSEEGLGDGFITVTRAVDQGTAKPEFLDTRKIQINYSERTGSGILPDEEAEIVALSDDIEILPNPARNYFIVQVGKEKSIQQIRLFDSFGKEIYAQDNWTNERQVRIATTDLPTGVYFAKIAVEDQVVTRRVLVQR
ncbi:MAG: T9SS type A sorting domain-containing protein [Bacteroidota bacterium]